jgi:hypothetical protein
MATQVSLNDGAVASAGALAIQTNGATQAVSISTGQVATLAQNPILTSGTANGVAYLNGSKVLTTGSALTYNGTDLAIGGKITSTVANNAAYQIAGAFTNGTNADFLVQLKASYTQIGPSTATPLSFAIGGTQAMTLDASGNLLVGTTSSTDSTGIGFKVRPSASGTAVTATHNTSGGFSTYHLYNINATNNGYRFYVNIDGGISNYSANNVNLSDRREKTNFAPASSYLDKICAIPVQTFNYIDQNMEDDGGLTLGVVAQDVQAVAPEMVMESNWGTEEEPKMRLSIYQTDLQYALMKCIQEQQALITQLTARITALESA